MSGSYFKVNGDQELEETVIWTGTVNTNEIVYKTADTSATTLTTFNHAGQG